MWDLEFTNRQRRNRMQCRNLNCATQGSAKQRHRVASAAKSGVWLCPLSLLFWQPRHAKIRQFVVYKCQVCFVVVGTTPSFVIFRLILPQKCLDSWCLIGGGGSQVTTLSSLAYLNCLSVYFGMSTNAKFGIRPFDYSTIHFDTKTIHHLCCFIYFRWIGAMILFTYHKGNFDCNGNAVLHTYLVGLLVVLGLIILSICAIVYVSAQGKFRIFESF